MTIKLDITFAAFNSVRFPAYEKSDSQSQPEHSYIALNVENGDCYVMTQERGNSTFDQYNNVVLTFNIPAETMAGQIELWINESAEKFQLILDGAEIVYNNNSNKCGKFTEKAWDLYLDMQNDEFIGNGEGGMIGSDYFAEWIQDDLFATDGLTVVEYACKLFESDGEGGFYFSDNMNSVDAIVSTLLNLWAEYLYNDGEALPKMAALDLIEAGTCLDSAFMDELRLFAGLVELGERDYELEVPKGVDVFAAETETNDFDFESGIFSESVKFQFDWNNKHFEWIFSAQLCGASYQIQNGCLIFLNGEETESPFNYDSSDSDSYNEEMDNFFNALQTIAISVIEGLAEDAQEVALNEGSNEGETWEYRNTISSSNHSATSSIDIVSEDSNTGRVRVYQKMAGFVQPNDYAVEIAPSLATYFDCEADYLDDQTTAVEWGLLFNPEH